MQMRLDKYLADMGVGTRSKVRQYIRKKQVQVNGGWPDGAGHKVDTKQDHVFFQGKEVVYTEKEYYMLYKPKGCVSAVTDPVHKTVLAYITSSQRKDLFPVGRLDLDTEGLLLITNDGALSHKLLSPGYHVPKTYFARVSGEVTEEDKARFLEGVCIGEDQLTLPAQLKVLSRHYGMPEVGEGDSGQGLSGREGGSSCISEIELTITEGKFHQVKRMFEAVGKRVLYLKRFSMGSLVLDGALKPGEYRALTEGELSDLMHWHDRPSLPKDWRIP